MIYINNATKKIGKDGLIIYLKANNFFEGETLRKEDFERLYKILKPNENDINLPDSIKNNLFLCSLYYLYDTNDGAKKVYEEEFSNNFEKKNNGGTKIELLHILFNIIEMEIKIKKKSESELKMLFCCLAELSQEQKKYEDFLLFKLYCGYLKYLMKSYEEADGFTTELISDLDKNQNTEQQNLIKYIRVRNVLLKIRILETKGKKENLKHIMNHLECLFSWTKNTKEDFAICLGIKMLSLQSEEVLSFEECIKLLKEMLNILKRETLFGKSHENILDQYLYLSGLLGYYSLLNDDYCQVEKITKKIDKYLSNVQDIIKSPDNDDEKQKNEKNIYKQLYQQYQVFNVMLKSSICLDNKSIKSNIETIKNFKSSNQNIIDDKSVINMYLIEKDDLKISMQYQNKEKEFIDIIESQKDIQRNKIISCYIYLYSQLSNLTIQVIENLNEASRKKDIIDARNFASKIINYTYIQVQEKNNKSLIQYLRLPFFKNLLSKLYFVNIYSYFLEGDYTNCLEEYNKYDTTYKLNYELDSYKNYLFMGKIKADCLFKLKKYEDAEKNYLNLASQGEDNPLIYFNLGLCYYFNEKKIKAIDALEKSEELFKKKNNEKKIKMVQVVIEKLKAENK